MIRHVQDLVFQLLIIQRELVPHIGWDVRRIMGHMKDHSIKGEFCFKCGLNRQTVTC